MTINILRFSRKPFTIDAVRVTVDNMVEVCEWCSGEIRTEEHTISSKGRTTIDKYIKVYVHVPRNDKQTKAYVSDWVLRAGNSFKVYTNKAFVNNFDEISSDDDSQTEGMEELFTLSDDDAPEQAQELTDSNTSGE